MGNKDRLPMLQKKGPHKRFVSIRPWHRYLFPAIQEYVLHLRDNVYSCYSQHEYLLMEISASRLLLRKLGQSYFYSKLRGN